MQPVHSYADKFFWLAFRPHVPSEYGWWFCNLFENVCSDVTMSHQVLRAGDITIWQPTEILFFRLPSDTCWNFNLTDTNAAYIYCRLKFLDSAHARLKKALIYPDTYRIGEDGLKRFDWGICGRESFCKYACVDMAINIIIDYININCCNLCARKSQVGPRDHKSEAHRSLRPLSTWLIAWCTSDLEKANHLT